MYNSGMSKLSEKLAEKYPQMEVFIGCGAAVFCKKTQDSCVQLCGGCITSHSIPDGWEATELPEKHDATGCSGCERNKS